ncbi:MAG TPA: CHAD domain-containing protein [Vicinamibacterales bacterium]|jgi:CHAD domain-containing protein|nr:CHAD domain-containing protein [Vicinamibacterales bacterium]
MAFRLKVDEPVPRALRRLAAKQLKDARDRLRGASRASDEAIHEARKSLKKARAIVQVIDADAGRHLGGSRRALRAVNRTLSGLRDADAMLGIFERLRTRMPQLIGERTFARVRRRLAAGKRAAREKVERRDDWKHMDRQLRALRKSAGRWRQAHRGFGALERGMRDAHRRGRKALARARKRQRAEDFHEWRKAMKALWYQLRLLGGRSRRIGRDAAALHRAEMLLGDEHNVVVLCGVLTGDRLVCRTAEDAHRVRLAGDRYQCEMRTRALQAARSVYAPKSGAYVRLIEREWKGSGRLSRA